MPLELLQGHEERVVQIQVSPSIKASPNMPTAKNDNCNFLKKKKILLMEKPNLENHYCDKIESA